MINRHTGSVNAVLFTNDGSHLLSGSDDGKLIATKVGSWITENVWSKPHTGKAVLKICLHESGKFAFTLGKDGTLRAWDMLRGRQASTTNVKDLSKAKIILDNIQLCPNGGTFAMSGLKVVTVVSLISNCKFYDELNLTSQVTSMCWINDENLLVGMQNGSIEWLNIAEEKHVSAWLELLAKYEVWIKFFYFLSDKHTECSYEPGQGYALFKWFFGHHL